MSDYHKTLSRLIRELKPQLPEGFVINNTYIQCVSSGHLIALSLGGENNTVLCTDFGGDIYDLYPDALDSAGNITEGLVDGLADNFGQ